MNFIHPFFYRFWQNLAKCFSRKNLLWHALAIGLTLVLVMSGFDSWWFTSTRTSSIFYLFIPAALLGFLVPVMLPIVLLALGRMRRDARLLNSAYALTQSATLAWGVSALYKAFTGRVHPMLFGTGSSQVDISHIFQFGFLRGGIFWGWPSSHTIVAFAIAATLLVLYPKSKWVKSAALVFALYVGIGVSLTIHWFSDFAAGAILGTLVGIVVGKAFKNRVVLP